MNLENVRYYFAVSLLVCSCAIFYTMLVVWLLLKLVPMEGVLLKWVYVVSYIIISFIGLRFYIPRLRKVV